MRAIRIILPLAIASIVISCSETEENPDLVKLRSERDSLTNLISEAQSRVLEIDEEIIAVNTDCLYILGKVPERYEGAENSSGLSKYNIIVCWSLQQCEYS